MDKNSANISRFLSLVLRHQPEKIGLHLDENGWADVQELITRMNDHAMTLDLPTLQRVVATNDKKRFAFSEDGSRIRALQGHSVNIDLALTPRKPPDILYHGTATQSLENIRTSGLHSGSRQHVHLSPDVQTARKVGMRHGIPKVLTISAGEMHSAGHNFHLSENGVWLTPSVPSHFIRFDAESDEE